MTISLTHTSMLNELVRAQKETVVTQYKLLLQHTYGVLTKTMKTLC